MVDSQALLPMLSRLREEVPGTEPLDAHTHLGANDPDGYRCSRDELVAQLELIDAQAIVFPMHEPDGYPPANDMVLAEAEAAQGRLFAFCRLDPGASPAAELRRCLEAGARGIKLHPRAEGFNLDHPRLEEVFALADEQRLPILCHAGRGIPALGRHAIEVCARYPGLRLILAHAGICDLSWIWREAPAHPNLFFDTAWWSPSDLQALFALVPPGPDPHGQRRALRHPRLRSDDGAAPRAPGGPGPRRAARDLRRPGAPPGRARDAARPRPRPGIGVAVTRPAARARLLVPHERDRADVPRDRPAGDARARPARLRRGRRGPAPAGLRRRCWSCSTRASAYEPGSDGRPSRFAPGIHLIVVAAALARTPDVPLPEPGRFAGQAPGTASR